MIKMKDLNSFNKGSEQMSESLQDEMYDNIEKANDQLNNLFTKIEDSDKLLEVEKLELEVLYDRIHSILGQLEQLVDYSS
jgi:hypothetical protein